MGGNGSGRHPKLCPCDYCKTSQRVQSQPDPTGTGSPLQARITELEAKVESSGEEYTKLYADRDRLQAEVERLKTVACNLSSTIRILERRNATARLALEWYEWAAGVSLVLDNGQRARDALAELRQAREVGDGTQ